MYFKSSIILFVVISCVSSRIHNIQIKNDNRKYIRLSNFAFSQAGLLHIKLSNFTSHPDKQHYLFGLTFDRIHNDGLYSYLNKSPDRCIILQKIIGERFEYNDNAPIIFFPFNLRNKKIKLICSNYFDDIKIIKPFTTKNLSNFNESENMNLKETLCSQTVLPINYVLENKTNYYDIEFTINMETIKDKGLYNMFFHNCIDYEEENKVFVDFNLEIQEKNGDNYLSATEIDLPKVYCIMALLYFLTANFWAFILWRRNNTLLKVHSFMAILIYLKFVSILLNYVNYKYIEKIGIESIVWSSLYYFFDFGVSMILFVSIILISSGWTIIKSNLQRKIKIILFLVVLLQITANVTKFYLDKTDKDDKEYKKLKELYIISDLLSCIFTLFPAVWTLKQLKRNSELEDNDDKLILFRKHFVLLLICIYCTRIIPYLIQIIVTEQVQYAWMSELFKELTLFVCFVLIGYIFRPVFKSYLTAISDDVNDIDSIISESDEASPMKENNFNVLNENWISTGNIINAIDEEEEASLLSEMKEMPLL